MAGVILGGAVTGAESGGELGLAFAAGALGVGPDGLGELAKPFGGTGVIGLIFVGGAGGRSDEREAERYEEIADDGAHRSGGANGKVVRSGVAGGRPHG
jgi:hypothetical protein